MRTKVLFTIWLNSGIKFRAPGGKAIDQIILYKYYVSERVLMTSWNELYIPGHMLPWSYSVWLVKCGVKTRSIYIFLHILRILSKMCLNKNLANNHKQIRQRFNQRQGQVLSEETFEVHSSAQTKGQLRSHMPTPWARAIDNFILEKF